MWNRSDVRPEKRYRLTLDQDGEKRSVNLVEIVDMGTPFSATVLATEPVPHELLASRDLQKIAECVRLQDGASFFVDAHGVWFTRDEMNAMRAHVDFGDVPWVTGIPPKLAPR